MYRFASLLDFRELAVYNFFKYIFDIYTTEYYVHSQDNTYN